ncbi:MAG: carboxylate-amine ligase [Alphaproteobacteria bacterium]
MTFAFRFGMEEEFFLVDRTSGNASEVMPPAFWSAVKEGLPDVSKELLQSQIEIQTPPLASATECRKVLTGLRRRLSAIAAEHGLGIIAAGTHPMFDWHESRSSPGARYATVVRDTRMLAFRNMFSGLHVHVEVPDGQSRVAIMARCIPYLPLLLALSTSSPFWRGQWTGMLGYRMTGYGEMPRAGLPPMFRDEGEYAAYVAALQGAKIIPNATFLWWAMRPSLRYPTLELRICDAVTRVDDAVAIANLYRCLVHRLVREPGFGPMPTGVVMALTDENKWQVQCDGLDATMVDVGTGQVISARSAIERFVAALRDDALALDCAGELDHIGTILARGTSAHEQFAILRAETEKGTEHAEALRAVVRWLAETSTPA